MRFALVQFVQNCRLGLVVSSTSAALTLDKELLFMSLNRSIRFLLIVDDRQKVLILSIPVIGPFCFFVADHCDTLFVTIYDDYALGQKIASFVLLCLPLIKTAVDDSGGDRSYS